jgi:hypothetical protein
MALKKHIFSNTTEITAVLGKHNECGRTFSFHETLL